MEDILLTGYGRIVAFFIVFYNILGIYITF